MTPEQAAATFFRLRNEDREREGWEAVRFSLCYENDAPEADYSVYLELVEAGPVSVKETATAALP